MIRGTLGPYAIEAVIGSGSTGTVYRAHLLEARHGLEIGDRVALKDVHRTLLLSPTLGERLEREARLGARVRHPSVVRTFAQEVLDAEDGEHHVLVMEFVEGQTLREILLESAGVSESLVRSIAQAVARGLEAIHAADAVHRDLKPENVLITPAYEVKIMDLGLAHLTDEQLQLTRGDGFSGSLAYAAPEQFPDADALPDGRSDLYALGVVLYELVTGERPLRARSPRQMLQAILYQAPRKAGQVNPQVSPFFEEVLDTLLAKDPKARFPTATALLHVLDAGETSAWWTDRAQELRRSMRGPLRRIRLPHETPAVGREAEIEALRSAFGKARDGKGQVMFLRGEAGIGKTRLVDELVRRLHHDGEPLDFLIGDYPPGSVTGGYDAFAGAFRDHMGAGHVRATLEKLFPKDWYLLPAFAAAITGEPHPAGAGQLTPATALEAFAGLTRKLAVLRPLVILIDDLHNAPEEGRAFFADMARSVQNDRVLLLGCGRYRLPATWVAKVSSMEHAQQLALERLAPDGVHRLLLEVLHAPGVVRDLEPAIALKSAGNPYFALEILRDLRERGRIGRRPDGTWVLHGRKDVIEIPSSLQTIIEARLARLGEAEREVLDVGACVGFSFDPLLVADVVDRERIPVLRTLGRLETNHRLVRSQGRDFAFDHHQLLEVLYATLPPVLREEYHGAIATHLTARLDTSESRGARGRLATEVCRHSLRSSHPALAAAHASEALDHLLDRHQVDEGIRLLEELLERPDLLEGKERFDLLLRLKHTLERQGRWPEQERVVEEAAELAETLDDDAMRRVVRLTRAHVAFSQTRLDEALEHFEASRAASAAAADRAMEGKAEVGLGLVAFRQGRFQDARLHFERSLAIAKDLGDAGTALRSAGNLAVVLHSLGHMQEALACNQEIQATARANGDLPIEGQVSVNIGILQQSMGQPEEARQSYARAVELADRVGDRMRQAMSRANLGSLLREQDRLAEATRVLEETVAIAEEIDDPIHVIVGLDNLGSIAITHGDYATAHDHLETALARCRDLGSKRDEAFVLENLGRLAEAEERWENAVAVLEEAEALWRELGAPIRLASTLAVLGRVLTQAGEDERACALLDEAIENARKHESPSALLRALAARLHLPGGSAAALEDALTDHAGGVPRLEELRGYFALWQATRDAEALATAHRLLEERVASTSPEHHDAMRARVPLHRDILQAVARGDARA